MASVKKGVVNRFAVFKKNNTKHAPPIFLNGNPAPDPPVALNRLEIWTRYRA